MTYARCISRIALMGCRLAFSAPLLAAPLPGLGQESPASSERHSLVLPSAEKIENKPIQLAVDYGHTPVGEIRRVPDAAPNIVVVLLDDVGFGATSTFGGPIPTPALDNLAANGLRYTRFTPPGSVRPPGPPCSRGETPMRSVSAP